MKSVIPEGVRRGGGLRHNDYWWSTIGPNGPPVERLWTGYVDFYEIPSSNGEYGKIVYGNYFEPRYRKRTFLVGENVLPPALYSSKSNAVIYLDVAERDGAPALALNAKPLRGGEVTTWVLPLDVEGDGGVGFSYDLLYVEY